MRITSDDLDGNIESEEPSYMQGGQTSTPTQGQGLSKYSDTLREVKEILEHLKDLGVMGQQQGPGQQPSPQRGQNPGSMEGSGPQPQGAEAGNPQQNQEQQIDQAVNQAYGQLIQFVQVAQEELSPEATLEETEEWMVRDEEDLKSMIRMQVEGQL